LFINFGETIVFCVDYVRGRADSCHQVIHLIKWFNMNTERVKKIHELFISKGWTLSVAESCTGGLLGHMLTFLPGASRYFKGGVIVYSTDMKHSILSISMDIIEKHGVVSEETACIMAEKIREITGTDYSIATTGNLGPDVLEGKERGLVYVCVSSRSGNVIIKELHLKGDRVKNKQDTVDMAIKLLIDATESEGTGDGQSS